MRAMALRIVVVGGGIAGLSSAWWLAGRGHRVTLVEREAAAGVHASGRNAGLVRHVVSDPWLLELGRRGAGLLLEPPPALSPVPLCERTGSVLLAGPREAPGLEATAQVARQAGVAVDLRRVGPGAAEVLGVRPEPDSLAITTADDGLARPEVVVDALTSACRRAGVAVVLGRDAEVVTRAGQVAAVRAGAREVPCDVVVDAAGPWAADLARAAGGADLPLVALRRHLFVATGWTGGAGPGGGAWAWDTERGLYARPWTISGDGAPALLLCACDEDARPPEDAQPEPAARERLADVLARAAPSLLDLEVRLVWAGLRTFTPDRRFVVGWDPRVSGLFWAAALGGHGLTSGLAVGDLVARAVDDRAQDDAALLAALSPARLAPAPRAGAPLVSGARA